MATLEMVSGAVRKDVFVISLDLSSACFHFWAILEFRRFMRFKFKRQLYQFRAMPFGLCSEPRLLMKVTHAFSHFCKQHGIRIIFHLGDTIILVQFCRQAFDARDFMETLFKSLGFMISLSKSDLAPSKQFTFWVSNGIWRSIWWHLHMRKYRCCIPLPSI